MLLEHLWDWRRTHTCGELRAGNAGETVRLAGWVHRNRDHGGVLFLDLRDRHGLVQVVFRPESLSEAVMEKARALRSEFVLAVTGTVSVRPDTMQNPNLATGAIEVMATELRILNDAQTPPFQIEDETTASEDLRLEYRYLDLRRPDLAKVIGLRHRITIAVRRFLDSQGFWEIETPMLVRPTPEGARDYLVPSRVHPGSFYALPQSPQLYKQILMVSGMDRYFQIARCLRDEDLRADRQPEHTQIDLEMSFVGEEDVFRLVEGLQREIVREATGVEVPLPFERIPYRVSMDRYGSDKPDLRFDFPLEDATELVRDSGFQVFDATVASGGAVKCLRVPGGGALSRKDQDELEALVKTYGAKGLARAKVSGGQLDGGIAKFLQPELHQKLIALVSAAEGDLLALVADRRDVACRALGALRSRIGNQWLKSHPEAAAQWRFLWVTEFPLFERDPATGVLAPAHHMFTMPMEEDLPYLESDPERVRGRLYDLVLNGYEMGSGSIRIHRRDVQEAVMRVVGLSLEDAERKFGFLLKAFQFGAPPHGGIGMGLDRLVMLFAGRQSLRDTIAFPKTTSASSLMDGCPAPVDAGDLKELRINVQE
ncbi:MAG: aspartate--tRNA ligase [Candidatus Eisenbacteria bacterium]|nr:aspartate--tRNA ligase [Candidatus Eisenbacteria bacterium]